jgi:DNA repair exonuclease SbcCD ATPase subunit
MKTRWTAFLTGAVLLAFAAAPAMSAEMSERELKKTLKQANRDWQNGRTGPAVESYSKVLDATEAGDARRSNALYAVGLTALGDGDVKRAQKLLGELGEDASPAHRAVVGAVSKLVGEAAMAHDAVQRLKKDLASQKAALQKERQQQQQSDGELTKKLTAAETQLAELQAELQASEKMRNSVAKDKKALAECEEKLEKVRKSLVDRSGG